MPGVITTEQALQKLRYYCAYQERCHQEVVAKLYALKVKRPEHEAVIAQLIEEGYLNEERYAIAYAGGKFRMKGWGKLKIENALKSRDIQPYCIQKALRSIDTADYDNFLQNEILKKANGLAPEHIPEMQVKIAHAMMLKGFEPNKVYTAVQQVMQDIKKNL